jgi:hypothetical protein
MEKRKWLAHFSLAEPREAVTHPLLNEFVTNIERVNQIAEQTPGFIWTLQIPDFLEYVKNIPGFEGQYLVINISLWESFAALKKFVYTGLHGELFKKRKDWFYKRETPGYVLWWVDEDHYPDTLEAKQHLDLLTKNGPSREAFDFNQEYGP